MITKRIDFNFTPLQIDSGIKISDSVPAAQTYDGEFNEFAPDYTITPLVVRLWVNVVDQDNIIANGDATRDLTNIQWTITEDSNVIKLGANDSKGGFSSYHNSVDSAMLGVWHNTRPDHPVRIRVSAEYVDRRMGQVHSITKNITLRCDAITQAKPTLYLDIAPHSIYNPLTDETPERKNVTIHASLRAHRNSKNGIVDSEVQAENRYFIWNIQRTDGSWSRLSLDDFDYFATVSEDGSSLIVDRELIGDAVTIKCMAAYDPNGTPSIESLLSDPPSAVVTIVRKLPSAEFSIEEQMSDITPQTAIIHPRAVARNVNGVVGDLEKHYTPIWYTSPDGVTMNYAGSGEYGVIHTDVVDSINGAVISLDMCEVGPLLPTEIENNTIWIDSDGALILIK